MLLPLTVAVLSVTAAAPKLAAPGLSGVKVDASLLRFCNEQLAQDLRARGFEVVTSSDMAAVMGLNARSSSSVARPTRPVWRRLPAGSARTRSSPVTSRACRAPTASSSRSSPRGTRACSPAHPARQSPTKRCSTTSAVELNARRDPRAAARARSSQGAIQTGPHPRCRSPTANRRCPFASPRSTTLRLDRRRRRGRRRPRSGWPADGAGEVRRHRALAHAR